MFGYKVFVVEKDGRLLSVLGHQIFEPIGLLKPSEYKLGEYTSPAVGNGPLCVLPDLEEAERFINCIAGDSVAVVIAKVEYEPWPYREKAVWQEGIRSRMSWPGRPAKRVKPVAIIKRYEVAVVK